MTLESGITFFIAIVIFAITPGPGVFALIAHSLNNGYKACIPLAIGMTLGDISYLIAAYFGLAIIALNYQEVFTIVRIIGALYLFYLGYLMWTLPLKSTTSEPSTHSITRFIQGAMISYSNPKVILFYIAFLPTFIDLTILEYKDVALISLLTFIALMLGLMTVAIFADTLKQSLQTDRWGRVLNRVAASLMLLAGGYLIWSIQTTVI